MKKLHEKMITAFGITALVAVFCYQVAYGTNESSYKRGYWLGFSDYSCIHADKYGSYCDDPYAHQMSQLCTDLNAGADTVLAGITNSTACQDGYIQGWAHWCGTDAKNCDILPPPS